MRRNKGSYLLRRADRDVLTRSQSVAQFAVVDGLAAKSGLGHVGCLAEMLDIKEQCSYRILSAIGLHRVGKLRCVRCGFEHCRAHHGAKPKPYAIGFLEVNRVLNYFPVRKKWVKSYIVRMR